MKVAVGLSGGVDSATTALLLKERGFKVIGLTMKLFSNQSDEIAHAKSICQKLSIDHVVLDFEEDFNSQMTDYLKASYESGNTPNPCVYCNKHFKYGRLLDYCLKHKIDFFATGHYAKVMYDFEKKIYRIFKSNDKRKDQTYNLYQLNQDVLKHLLFPLGDFASKNEVRNKSVEISKTISSKKDSTGICFIDSSIYSFLKSKNSSAAKEGSFVDTEGNFLGRHRGICNYTIGQKKNLFQGSSEKDLAVTDIIPSENKVVLGSESELLKNYIELKDSNVLNPLLSFPCDVDVKLSQWSTEYRGTLFKDANGCHLEFKDPVRAPAIGQSLVFYDGEELLGGGVIESAQFKY